MTKLESCAIFYVSILLLWFLWWPPEVYTGLKWAANAFLFLFLLMAALGSARGSDAGTGARSALKPILAIAIFFICLVVSTAAGVDAYRSAETLLGYSAVFAFAFGLCLARGQTLSRRLETIFLCVAAALGLYGLYQYVYVLPELVASPEAWSGLSKDEILPVLTRMAGGRVFSRFALPSTFSCVLLAAVPFLHHRIRHSEKLWPWSLLLLLTTLNLILARSFAAVLLFCLYWWADAWIRHPAARWKISAPAAAACVLAIFLLRPESLVDFSSPANPMVLRWANWKVAVHEWMSAPWFGVGPGNFSLLFPAYTSGLTETRYAHGFHMTILAETGLAGLATAVALLAYLAGWIRRGGPATPSAASVALVLAYSLVDIVFELPSLSFLFFLLLGLTIPAPLEPGRSVRRATAAFAAAGAAFSLVLYFADGYYEQGMNALTSTRSSRQTYQAAGRHFERAGRMWPAARVDAARGQGELALARVEHNPHRLNAALQHLTNAVEKSPATVNYRVALAETLLEVGDPARALIHFKEAARLDPRGPHAGRYTKILLDQMPAPPVP